MAGIGLDLFVTRGRVWIIRRTVTKKVCEGVKGPRFAVVRVDGFVEVEST